MRDWTVVGRIVGEQALRRLRAPLPEIVNVSQAAYTALEFDERQLRRWSIPRQHLAAAVSRPMT